MLFLILDTFFPYMLHKRRMWLYLLFSSCLIIGFIICFLMKRQCNLYVENLQKKEIGLHWYSAAFWIKTLDMPLSSVSRTSIPTKLGDRSVFWLFFISTLPIEQEKDERTGFVASGKRRWSWSFEVADESAFLQCIEQYLFDDI